MLFSYTWLAGQGRRLKQLFNVSRKRAKVVNKLFTG